MKSVSTMVLGLALALGSAITVGALPAAAKEKAPKPPTFNISKPVREAVAAAQTALKAGDTATASAKLAEAKTAATSEDDKYVVASVSFDVARQTQNQAGQLDAIETMLASGKVAAEQQASYYTAAGQLAYQTKQYRRAETNLDQAVKLNAPDPNVYALLVEAKNANGKPAEAVEMLETAIAKQKAAGQPVPSEWYGRGLSIALAAKGVSPADRARLNTSAGHLGEGLVNADPKRDNWRDALMIYRDLNKIDADQELDLMRLMRTAKALKGERDYMDYVQVTYLKFPAEAKAVLEEGKAAGFVNLASGNAMDLYNIVKGKIAADKASLSKAPGTARAALANGDAYMGYNEWATAADFYRAALAKGGVDANVVNTRLGQALAASGQKDAAKQAFGAITGARAGLARYWLIFLDKSSI